MVTILFLQDTPQLGLSLSSDKHNIKWTKCADLPVPVRVAYSTIIDDVMYIGGGVCPHGNDQLHIFMYQLKENKWSRLPTPLPHYGGVVVNINNNLTVIGGKDHNNRPTNKVLTLQDDQWTSLYGHMNSARHRPAVLPHHHYTIIVAGGRSDHKVVVDSIEVFDGHQWTISKTCLPEPMSRISATTSNNSLIIAGYSDADGQRSSGVYITTIDDIIDHSTTSSSTDDNKWTPLARTPYWNTTIVPYTTPPVIVGGSKQGNTTDDIMAYDDSTNSWRTVSSSPIKCCHTTILSLPHTIIMAGGYTDGRTTETANATSLTSVMVGELVETD